MQITEQALVDRLNKKLSKNKLRVVKTSGESGHYHVVDLADSHRIVEENLTQSDLENRAKKLKVMTDWDNTWAGKAARLHAESGKGDGTFGQQRSNSVPNVHVTDNSRAVMVSACPDCENTNLSQYVDSQSCVCGWTSAKKK
jgi:hypothetical protein